MCKHGIRAIGYKMKLPVVVKIRRTEQRANVQTCCRRVPSMTTGKDTKLLLLPLLILFSIRVSVAVKAHQHQLLTTPSSRPINLFIVNEEDNALINKSVTNALKFLRKNHPDKLGKVYTATVNRTNSQKSLDAVCAVWKSALTKKEENIPDFVLDTTTYGAGAEIINRFTALVGIPTLTAQFGQEGDLLGWREITDEQNKYLVHVMNPVDLIPEVIRQHCLMFNISNAAILFDENFIMDHKYERLLENVSTRHAIVRIKKPGIPMKKQILKLRNLNIVNFFVLGSDSTIAAALETASNLNFTGRKYGWFVLTLNGSYRVQCAKCKSISYMLFKPQTNNENQRQRLDLLEKGVLSSPLINSAFYYDLTRLGVLAMKLALDNGDWKRPHYLNCDLHKNFTVAQRNFDFRQKLQQVSRTDFTPTFANFHWGSKNGMSHAEFDVIGEVITIENFNFIDRRIVEIWPSADIKTPIKVKDMDKAKANTAVTSYRIVTVIKPPFIMYDNETGIWSGLCIDLLNHVRKYVPFEYDIKEVADKKYGAMDEKGMWNGMVRELKDRNADIALAAMAVMAERENVIDYTIPFYDLVGISILRKKPKPIITLFKFITVFQVDVWICILGAYFSTSLLMWFFDKFSPYSYQNNMEKYKDDEEKRLFTLRECFWFCMTTLTPQGGGEAPKNLSGRFVAATWWLFGFIIVASYTANLAAYLTLARFETSVESLEDLSKQYRIQYAPIANTTEYRYFERMAYIEKKFYDIWKDMSLNDSLPNVERAKLAVWDYPISDRFTKMFHTMSDTGFPQNMEEALNRVNREGRFEFALIGDAADIKYLVMTNCELMQVGGEFSRKPYAIGLQQNSPLKNQFDYVIMKLTRNGQLEKLKNKWWTGNFYQNCDKPETQYDSLSVRRIGGIFIMIVGGIITAFFVLVLEYYYFRLSPKLKSKKLEKQQIFKKKQKPKTESDKTKQTVESIKYDVQAAPATVMEPTEYEVKF